MSFFRPKRPKDPPPPCYVCAEPVTSPSGVMLRFHVVFGALEGKPRLCERCIFEGLTGDFVPYRDRKEGA